MIKKGDKVNIKQEYQDAGDDLYHWVAVDDEEKGWVSISPSNIDLSIKPVHVVNIDMLECAE